MASVPTNLETCKCNSIAKMIAGYDSPWGFYVAKLTEGISTLGVAFSPELVIVRMWEFSSTPIP